MLVLVRPLNEALLRARVPGAQDQCGYPSRSFHRGGSARKKGTCPAPLPFSAPGAKDQQGCHSHLHLIIGTGPGGGTLAPSGKKILLFERGGYSRRVGNGL